MTDLKDKDEAQSFGRIIQSLREDILNGDLQPGLRLRMAMLSARYNAGASPLREALSRLVSDNLVVANEGRGFEVAPVSLEDFRSLTDLRKLLEVEAVRLSLANGDDRWEADLVGAFHRLARAQERLAAGEQDGVAHWEDANKAFHETLVSACGSSWLLNTRTAIYVCAERYRRICLSTRSVSRNVHEEHRHILEAALARDVGKIGQLLSDHFERTFDNVARSKILPAAG